MAENILQQFGTQLFSNSCRVMSDLYEYHDYIAYGVIKDDKITGFCQIVWNIEFSSVYLPLSHIIIGIADTQYRHNRDLESDVPTVKYGEWELVRMLIPTLQTVYSLSPVRALLLM